VVTVHGDLQLDQQQSGLVTIKNRSNREGVVIGMDRSCRCFELTEEPVGLVIPAQSQVELSLVIKPNKTGRIIQRIVLFLRHPDQFDVPINLFGSVTGEK